VTRYFGAFIIDPDGNKLEAITFQDGASPVVANGSLRGRRALRD